MEESRNVPTNDLDLIDRIVASHPDGLSRPQLEDALRETGAHIPWRTLLRRLDTLVAAGRLTTRGSTRARRYLAGPASRGRQDTTPTAVRSVAESSASAPAVSAVDPEPITLSDLGEQVRQLVRRPLAARAPIGYQANFLERYEPGVTEYLPEAMRSRLADLGHTPDAERPAGTYAREILGNLLIDLSWASSRLEGNRYTRLDTQRLIELGEQAEGRDVEETQMILNHKRAIEMLVEQADLVGFNRYTFLNLHSALSQNLLGDEAAEGRLRWQLIRIGNSSYLPLGIPQRIEQYFTLMLEKASAIPDPFEQSFFVMVQLPYLQPFADVNKRTSRLGANIPLIKANLRPLSFVDVPEEPYAQGLLGVYELQRIDLLRRLHVGVRALEPSLFGAARRDGIARPDPYALRRPTLCRDSRRRAARLRAISGGSAGVGAYGRRRRIRRGRVRRARRTLTGHAARRRDRSVRYSAV